MSDRTGKVAGQDSSGARGNGPSERIEQVRQLLSELKDLKFKNFVSSVKEALFSISNGDKVGKLVAILEKNAKEFKQDRKNKSKVCKVVSLLRTLNKEMQKIEKPNHQDFLDHARVTMHIDKDAHPLIRDFGNLLNELDDKLQGLVFDKPFESTKSQLDEAMVAENISDVNEALTNFIKRVHSDQQFIKSSQGKDLLNLVQLMIYSYEAQSRILAYIHEGNLKDLDSRDLLKDIWEQDLLNSLIKQGAAKSVLPQAIKEYFNIKGLYVIPQNVLKPVFKKSHASRLGDKSIELLSILYRASKEISGQSLSIDVNDASGGLLRGRLSTADHILSTLVNRNSELKEFADKKISDKSKEDLFLDKIVKNLIDHANQYLVQANDPDPQNRIMTEELSSALNSITIKQKKLMVENSDFETCFRACRNAMLTTIEGARIGALG